MAELCIAQHPEADQLLAENPFALLIGMALDQQIPMEHAFWSPFELQNRLGKPLTPEAVANTDPSVLEELFRRPRALHRFPAAHAKRIQALARVVDDEHDGDTAAIWNTALDGATLVARVDALPSFGERKARIFVALLAKQLGIKPKGWKEACSPFGEQGTKMTVADVTSVKALAEVRAWKKEQKQAAKQQAE